MRINSAIKDFMLTAAQAVKNTNTCIIGEPSLLTAAQAVKNIEIPSKTPFTALTAAQAVKN